MFNLLVRRNRNRNLSLFDDSFFDGFFTRPTFISTNQTMKTDLREEDDRYLLDIELPGLEKDDIKLSLEEGYLTVAVTKEDDLEEKGDNYLRRERFYGSCSRTFHVGNISEEDIAANYNNGILTISVPKEEDQTEKKKYIEIQ